MNIFQFLGVRVGTLTVSVLSLVSMSQVTAAAPYPRLSSSQDGVIAGHTDLKLSSTHSPIESRVPFQIAEGEGGAYTYEIWQTLRGSEYYLFIWEESHDETDEPAASYNFRSATEAMNFFTCRYVRVRIASCNMLLSSISYNVPETCAFPWRSCVEFYEEPEQEQ
ncbi:MAG: hypothetical protein VKL39_21130 [Leptolyngbyaceae bacterium]|nr:hypothetical protein [Leptolyngbyaceae bacterium]